MSVHDLLRDNDDRFGALARGFSGEDWARPSLCGRWSNHEVLAHLVVGVSASLRSVAVSMARHRCSFDSANADMARALAAVRSPAELLADYGELSRLPEGLGRHFPSRLLLGDHVTHELDIVYALDREPEIAHEALVAVLNTQVAVPNPFVPAYRNAKGLRLRAIDAPWRHGERGPVVAGRAAELVSALGNRPKVIHRLDGDGVAMLEARLSRRSRTGV
jgi:uncharacterized protein (TIGR03083 family)